MYYQLLQLAVLGPWILKASNEIDSPYFRIGLKLVAGALMVSSVRALAPEVQRFVIAYQEAQKIQLPQTDKGNDNVQRRI